MTDINTSFINGAWVNNAASNPGMARVNPATQAVHGQLRFASEAEVNQAVQGARSAFASWSQTTPAQRADLLRDIQGEYKYRMDDLGQALTADMGAPAALCKMAQVPVGLAQLQALIDALPQLALEKANEQGAVLREPMGVAALITAWNWPYVLMTAKVGAALAAGCTVVLKPSEFSPHSAQVFAEVLQTAGVPAGVFNLVQGDGAVGAALCAHPQVDMVSFTGSTRAGVQVAQAAAPTVKRVAQELGGKSPLVILPDANLQDAVVFGVKQVVMNSGQTCVAPTRVLVPADRYDEALGIAQAVINQVKAGDPNQADTQLGPVANERQFKAITRMLADAKDSGARLIQPQQAAPTEGFFIAPTVVADVRNDNPICQEEVFGPVLCVLPYQTEDEAVAIANDTRYGLAGYVYGTDVAAAKRVGQRLRAGSVRINGAPSQSGMPFGGYKQSGNGREGGLFGIEEFMEIKSMVWA